MKNYAVIALSSFLFFGGVSLAAAQTYESPLTPLQTSSVIAVNKTVQTPGTSTFSDNLGPNDAKYQPGATIPFQVTVRNTGNARLTNIRVTDNFPQFMGNAQNSSASAVLTIPSLEPGQAQTLTFTGRVAAVNTLPADQRVFCLVNQAVATAGNQTSSDNAQVCVENTAVQAQALPQNGTGEGNTKGGLPIYQPQNVTSSPSTGPEMISLGAIFTSGLAGVFLRRRTK